MATRALAAACLVFALAGLAARADPGPPSAEFTRLELHGPEVHLDVLGSAGFTTAEHANPSGATGVRAGLWFEQLALGAELGSASWLALGLLNGSMRTVSGSLGWLRHIALYTLQTSDAESARDLAIELALRGGVHTFQDLHDSFRTATPIPFSDVSLAFAGAGFTASVSLARSARFALRASAFLTVDHDLKSAFAYPGPDSGGPISVGGLHAGAGMGLQLGLR